MSANPQRPERGMPLPRGVYRAADSRLLKGMFRERLEKVYTKSNAATAEAGLKVTVSGSLSKGTATGHSPAFHIDVVVASDLPQLDESAIVKQGFRALAGELCEKHPAISTYEGIFGGVPHIKDVRLTVAHVLAQVRNLGSIDAIVEYYDNTISKEQVKEAITYAQHFMEVACAPAEANG